MIQNPSFRVLNFELSYTKFIYDPDIPIMSILIYSSNSIVYLKKKKKKKKLQLKTFTLTLELNPQSQVCHLLFTVYSSNIYSTFKIQIGYQFTSNFHANLQSHSYGCLVDSILFSELNHKFMIYKKSYKTTYSNLS